MKNASSAEGREQGERRKAELFFPSDGNFSTVVPLSKTGVEAVPTDRAPAAGEPERQEEREGQEEQEETTLIRARAGRGPRAAHAPRAKKGGEQSWVFMAAVLFLSVAAGVAAGAYMIRSQRPAEVYSPAPPAGVDAPAAAEVGKAIGTEPAAGTPAAETSTPQTSEPAPETEEDSPATEPASAAAMVAPAASGEAVTKVERVNVSASTPKASPQAAEPAARRVAEAEPRTVRRASAGAGDASPTPRLTRTDAPTRRTERPTSAKINSPAQPPLVSSPPPSARSKKVIQWP